MDLDDAMDLMYQIVDECELDGWSVGFDESEQRFGCCHYNTRKITLSLSLTELNEEDVVKDVILHEVAHAMVGYDEAHGPVFQRQARMLGCSSVGACVDGIVNSRIPTWAGRCPSCGQITARMWRLSQRAQAAACSPCCRDFNGSKFSNRFQLQWERA